MQTTAYGEQQDGFYANQLKWIAIAAMIIDHIADGFIDAGSWLWIVMRLIGRITGPTMFYMVAVGYRHTRSKNRYMLRLAAFAVISYLPYIYFHTGALPGRDSWINFSVIYTILLGLLAIRARHEVKSPALRVVILIVLMTLAMAGDWGVTGFLMMVVFDYFYGDREKQTFSYLLVACTDGGLSILWLYPFMMYLNMGQFDFAIYPQILYRLGMVLPIVLLWFYNGEKGNGGALAKWSFYIIYPLHFLILGFIKYSLLGS